MRKKKSPLKSAALQKRKQKILIVKIIACALGVVLIFGSIIGLSRLKSLQIASVVVDGNSAVDPGEIQEIAEAALKGNYGYTFPRANKLIYPKQKILADVIASSPRIVHASAKVHGTQLAITIQERIPAYTWCTGLPQDSMTSKKCYFMDDQGLIFSEAPIFSGNVFFAFYGIISDDPIRKTYLNNSEFKNIDSLISFLDSQHLHPYAFRAEESGSYELYLEQGGKIIFKRGQDISLLQSNLKLVITNTLLFPEKKQQTASTTLDYIDLRFGNKLFYRQKGDNQLQLEQ